MRIIIVAGSPVKTLDQYTYQETDFIIGVDSGCDDIINAGLKLDFAVGDFDTTKSFDNIKKKAASIKTYLPEKNEIDLELALIYAYENYPKSEVIIYNAIGGRIDHELINFKLLMKYSNLDIKIIGQNEIIYFKTNSFRINDHKRFSLIVLSNVTIDINNAMYNLEKTNLSISDNFTSSNESLTDTTINVYNGGVLVIEEA